jgi:hypothetical protein
MGILSAISRREEIVGEYEERQKKVSEAYGEYRDEFYREGSGIGDQRRAGKIR